MVNHYRIVHAPDPAVNPATNEFLIVPAGKLTEVIDRGFREVGKAHKIKYSEFPVTSGWFPSMPLHSVGRNATRDKELMNRIGNDLNGIFGKEGLDSMAFPILDTVGELADSQPVSGKLYMVTAAYADGMADLHTMKEMFFVNAQDSPLVFRRGTLTGLHMVQPLKEDRFYRDTIKIEGTGYSIPYILKQGHSKIKEIREVGEMEIAPKFLREVRISPRNGWSGIGSQKPRLGPFQNFERYLEEEKRRN